MLGLPPRASHLQQSLHVNLHQCGSQDVCQNSYAQKVLLFFMNDMSHVEVSPVFVGLTGNLTVGHVENQQSVRWSHRTRSHGPIEISGWKSPWLSKGWEMVDCYIIYIGFFNMFHSLFIVVLFGWRLCALKTSENLLPLEETSILP